MKALQERINQAKAELTPIQVVQEAMSLGQEHYDALDPKIKEAAKVAAEQGLVNPAREEYAPKQ